MRLRSAARRLAPALLLALAAAQPPRISRDPEGPPERDWTGVYGLRLRMGTLTRLPLLGSAHSVTTTLVLASVRRGPSGWVQAQRVCDVRIDASVPMTVPPGFVASLPHQEFPAAFPTSIAGSPYLLDLGVDAMGYDPTRSGGRVPERASDPSVRDSDGDGQPGATVVGHFPLFGAVSIYFAQRLHLVLRGTQVAPGRIAGALEVRELQQRTLGASSRFFRRSLQVRPDAAASTFVMVPLAPTATCDDVRRRESALFR